MKNERYGKRTAENTMDISMLTDQVHLLSELRSIENHLGHSTLLANRKEKKKEFTRLKEGIREIRTFLLKEMLKSKDPQFEEWCILKHLAGGIESLKEVADKEKDEGKKTQYLGYSSDLLDIFLMLYRNMKDKDEGEENQH